jgi:hypothetical protein
LVIDFSTELEELNVATILDKTISKNDLLIRLVENLSPFSVW